MPLFYPSGSLFLLVAGLFACQFALAAQLTERDNLVTNLATMWSQQSGESFNTMAQLFAPLSDTRLEAVQNAATMDEVRDLLGVRFREPGGAGDPRSAGDGGANLTFTPVTPCRIVDTRETESGPIQEGESRAFKVYGSGDDIEPQGGNRSGCPSPGGEPRAVHINVTHLSSVASGYLTVYPADVDTPPVASWVNPQEPPNPIGNAGTVETGYLMDDDIKVFASNVSHVVIDVMGYYYDNAPGQSYYHRSGRLNKEIRNIKSSYERIDKFLDFTKQHAGTRIEVFLNTRAYSGKFKFGTDGILFQVRIDDKEPDFGNEGAITTSNTTDFIAVYAVFEDLDQGEHTVSVWAKAPSGEADDVGLDLGGWGGRITVREAP